MIAIEKFNMLAKRSSSGMNSISLRINFEYIFSVLLVFVKTKIFSSDADFRLAWKIFFDYYHFILFS